MVLLARFVLLIMGFLFGPPGLNRIDLAGRIFGIVILIPGWVLLILFGWSLSAALVKRFHDLNLSGWLALVYLPLFLIYPVLLIVQGCIKGTNGPRRYGGDPLAVAEL